VKYNEQLLLTLEEDEFSCKQRLAYKLVHVISCSPPPPPPNTYRGIEELEAVVLKKLS
jgi:hypothetical protein